MCHGLIEDVAAEIGFTAALRLIGMYGGRNVAIPIRPIDGHPMTQLIGHKAMQRLCAVWGGSTIWVPNMGRAEADQRTYLVLRMLNDGIGTRVIGSVLDISERRVQQIRRDLEAEGKLPLVLGAGAAGETVHNAGAPVDN